MGRKGASEADHETLGGLAGETVRAINQFAESDAVLKVEKTANKAEKKATKKLKKAAKKTAGRHRRDKNQNPNIAVAPSESRFTPRKARNAVSVAKVLAPVIVPIVTPFAVRSAGAVREGFDRYRAHRLGVEVGRLSQYNGRGGGLLARVDGIHEGLADLRKSGNATESDIRFADQTQETLTQLSASVRATGSMPTRRRKSAHRAVSGELDNLEKQLLARLGVQS
jgi:hypothetical protein